MHVFLSNLANRQTDRQTDRRGQKHLRPPLSEVNNRPLFVYVNYRVACFLLLVIQMNKDEYKAENIEKFRIIELNITRSCNSR